MNNLKSIKTALAGEGFYVGLGVLLLILIGIGLANKKSLKGTGRFANTMEIVSNMANWAKFPLSFVAYLGILFGLSSIAGILLYRFDPQFLSIQDQWPTYLGGILILSVFVFFVLFEAVLMRGDKNRFPIGKTFGLFPMSLSLPEKARFEHIRIVGPSGSGKSSAFMYPQLMEDALGDCTSIFLAVKPSEVYDKIAGAWTAQGKKVVIFDPFHKDCIGFEPLQTIGKKQGLPQLVEAVYGRFDMSQDPTSVWFESQERRLFSNLCELVLGFSNPEQQTLSMVYELVSQGLPAIQETVTYCRNPGLQSKFELHFRNNNHRIHEIINGVLNRIDFCAQPEIAAAFSRPDLDLDLFSQEPVLLILASPHSNPNTRVAAAILLRALILKIYEKPTRESDDGKSIFFYLDEFNALHLPDIADFANTSRSARAGIILVLQAEDQLMKYSKEQIVSILANSKTTIYLQGCDAQTCKVLSERLGKRVVKEKRKSRSMKHGTTISVVEQELPLMTQDSIENMPEDQALILSRGMRALIVKQVRFYDKRRYKNQIGLPVKAYRPNLTPLRPPHFKDVDIPAFPEPVVEGSPISPMPPKTPKEVVVGWED